MIKFAPNAQLTAIVDNWAPYYIDRVQAVLDGTWQSQDMWGGIKDGEVVMAPYTNMPDEVKAEAEQGRGGAPLGRAPPLHRADQGPVGRDPHSRGANRDRRADPEA